MRIIFLPPKISFKELNDFADWNNYIKRCESFRDLPRPNLGSLNRISKSTDEIVYAVELESNTDESFLVANTQILPRINADKSLLMIRSQQSPAEIRELYHRLRLNPLDELAAGSANDQSANPVNIYGFVVSTEEIKELISSKNQETVKMSVISVLDFDLTSTKAVRVTLWRNLAPWSKNLQLGDIIQIRDVILNHEKDTLGASTTSSTSLFLLGRIDNGNGRETGLSARVNHLNPDEQSILEFLKYQTVRYLSERRDIRNFKIPVNDKRTILIPLSLKSYSTRWILKGKCVASSGIKEVILDANDRRVSVITAQLIECFEHVRVSLDLNNPNPSIELGQRDCNDPRRSFLASHLSYRLFASLLDSISVQDLRDQDLTGYFKVTGVLSKITVPIIDYSLMNNSSASLITSQPDQLILKDNTEYNCSVTVFSEVELTIGNPEPSEYLVFTKTSKVGKQHEIISISHR